MIVAGIGCRKGISAQTVIEGLNTVAGEHGVQIDFIATAPVKADEPGLLQAATQLAMAFVVVAQADFDAAGARTLTQSSLSLAHGGSPSVSEAAALAALGPHSILIAPRRVIGNMTVALATLGDAT